MQTRFSFSLLLAFAALLVFSSCNKSNKVGRYIPKNATIVFHVNGESVTSKLPWEEIKQNQLFQELYADTSMDAVIKAALDNPENTGIDTKNDFTIYIQMDSVGNYVAVQGKVKDADKFKAFYTNATKGTVVPGKEGVSSLSNEKMMITWNKDRFVILLDAPQVNTDMAKTQLPGMDSLMPEPVRPVVKRDLSTLSAYVFDLEENLSLAKDEKFSELVNNKGDVHFWINAGEIASKTSAMSGITPVSMLNLTKLYDGTLVTGTASFLDGKIEVDMKSYGGKEMTDLLKKYEGSKISSEMVKRIPAKDIAVLFAMNFKPEGLREFLKLTGLEGMANMGAGFLGFTVDDFVNANKGDIVIAVSDINKDSSGKQNANFLFSAGINDKAAFGKLIEAGKKAGESKLRDSMPAGIFYNSNDKYFVMGNKQANVDSYLKGESNSTFDFFDKISGSPVGLFINLQYFMRTMSPDNADSAKMATYNASVQMWESMIAKGGEFKDGGIIQHAEINLVDKKVNSLKQLNNYFGTLGTIHKNNKKSKTEISLNLGADSTVVIESK